MNIISCSLQFERPSDCYRPGEVIKGLLILTVNGSSTILIKALSIQFSGYASTKWEKPQETKKSAKPKPQEYYVNREDYISSKNYLIGSEQANPSGIQPGVYNYSFMVHIPQNAPSTFDSPLGSIRYELQVNADYIDRIDCLCSCPINVERLKDLRRLESATPTATESEKHEHKPCLKFWRHPLQLYVSIPQGGYVVGECISVHVKVSNYGKLKLKDITSKLNRIVSYKGAIKEKKPKETTDITSIACNIHSMFGQNSSVIQHLQQVYVPKTPPSLDSTECKCISIAYELEVTICAQNHKRYVTTAIPIVIGSISLTSDVKMLEENINSHRVPTITVARSMDELNLPSRLDMEDYNQTEQMSVSTTSLASSFKEADYMTPVKLNKKSKCQLSGDPVDFKPKYLYYDLPEELQTQLRNDMPSTSNYLQSPPIVTRTIDEKL